MIKFYLFLILSLFYIGAVAQEFKGQWKGSFADKSVSIPGWGGNTCEYILELETKGNTVTGYSYTYFSEGGKNFYTICKVSGTINRSTKSVEVTEIVRTKTNVPVNIGNCFQVHKLSYTVDNGVEMLQGKWVPAANQSGNCGFGYTSLVRRKMNKAMPGYNTKAIVPSNNKNTIARQPAPKQPAQKSKPSAPIAKNNKPVPAKPVEPIKTGTDEGLTDKPVAQVVINKADRKIDIPAIALPPGLKFEKRSTNLLKTIITSSATVKIDLYDNGTIDGDSISLFYNGTLILAQKKLTTQALTFELPVLNNVENELVMYADNLGSIPPNTALLVVTDGNKRYELRITSDLQRSGSVKFVHTDQ